MGADKAYDTFGFVSQLGALNITPHIARNDTNRRSVMPSRTVRSSSYDVSQQKRKLVEEIFGWLKAIGLCRKMCGRGKERVAWSFTFASAVYNLLRIRNLAAQTAPA